MKFTPTWYKNPNFTGIPSFQEMEDVTGTAYDDKGNYIGPKEKPKMQMVIDRRTKRQYWAPEEYDEDAVKYGAALLEREFNSKEWWGMVNDPLLSIGEEVSVAYLELLKQGGKTVAKAPTEIVAGVTGMTDAVGIDAGNLAKSVFATLNPVAYFGSQVARKGIKATAQDYVDLLKNIKTPKGEMGETAALYRASAKNWEATLDKWVPDVDDNIKAHSTLVAIGSMTGQIGGSLLLAAATSSVGGLPAVAGVFGSQQFYNLREEYLAKGYSLQSANIWAGVGAILEGGLEALGFSKWLKYATLKPSLRNHLIAGLMESSQEMAQTTAEAALTNFSGVREETLVEVLAQIAIAGVAGFIPGAGISLVSGGIGIRTEKAKYELDKAIEQTPKPVQPTTKEGQYIKGPNAKQELELAKANKGSNPVYEFVRNLAVANGIKGEEQIDALFYFARNLRAQGIVGEELLQGLGKQMVAYNKQLALPDKTADKENKKAAEDITYHLSEEAVNKFCENTKSAAEKIGLSREEAERVADSETKIYTHFSQEFGEDVMGVKQVEYVVPSREEVKAPTVDEALAEAQAIDGQIAELKKIEGTQNQIAQLEQEKGKILSRGYIDMSGTINKIVLGNFSDVTTIKHELMHHWQYIIKTLAAKGNKKAQALQKQIDKIIAENKDYVKQDANKEAEVLTEAYEAWLYTGVADTTGQQGLFDALQRFFQSVYSSVKDITGIRINGEIDYLFRQMTGLAPIDMRGEGETNTNQQQVQVFNQPLIEGLDTNQRVNVVDLTTTQIKNKGSLVNFVSGLINDKENTSDGKIINFIKTVRRIGKKNVNVPQHIVYSSFKRQDQDIRAKSILDIQSLIQNSVLVSEEPAKSDKRDYDKAFRFYVPVRVGKEIYTVRILALHNRKEHSFDLSSDLYDVILENNQRSASAIISDTESGNADTISITEMLQNVKDHKGNPYILPDMVDIDGVMRHTKNSEGRQIAHTIDGIRNFYKWFGDSKVVDEQGRPLVVYHGSTKEFEIFDISKANPESDLGKGFYFTNNEDDVNANYHGGGPDFENKVDRIAERIQDEEELEWEQAKAKAYEQEYQTDALYEVYLKMENPFVIGGENETVLTFEEPYNEETDEYGEPEGTLLDFAYNMDNYLADLGIDYKISQELFMRAADNGGEITASEIYEIIEKDENLLSLLDYESSFGELLSNAVAQEYDGFIDHTVNQKFGSERKTGRQMVGMDTGTTHYIVFEPTQIKSVDNQGTFDPNKENIFFQTGFHGSPHRFDKFSLSHIGSGEGAQAHGWGLYVAKALAVGEKYRRRLSRSDSINPDYFVTEEGVFAHSYLPKEHPLYIGEYIKEDLISGKPTEISKIEYEEAYKEFLKTRTGQLYKVEIPENDVLLDEQKTLKEQPNIAKLLDQYAEKIRDFSFSASDAFDENMTGREIYDYIAEILGDGSPLLDPENWTEEERARAAKAASLYLNAAGIKGIKYDGAQDGEAFVIFDDKAIRIQQTFYQTIKAQQTGAKAADEKPSKEQIAKDLDIIKRNGVEKYEKKSGMWNQIGEIAQGLILSVRQRAGAIDPKLKAFFDKLDYFQPALEKKFADQTKGWFKKYHDLSEEDKNEFDYYVYNQLHEELDAFLKEKNMTKEYQDVRNLLNFIYSISNQAGIDMGFISEYFPTSMIDHEGFLSHMKGTEKWTYIEKSLKEADPQGLWDSKQRAEAVNKLLRGYKLSDPVSKPKNAKERTILYKSPELMKFYEHSDKALMKYLQGMSRAIAINKAYGKGAGFDTDATIGAIVLDLIEGGHITRAEEDEVRHLLKSRLSYSATPQIIGLVKNVGYLGMMNNITSAVTQLGDLYAPFYKYSFPTAIQAIFGKKELDRSDLGLDNVWEEFSDKSKSAIWVDGLFKAIGLDKMDQFGKAVAIQASIINMRKQAEAGDIELLNRLAYTFGKDANRVLADIKSGKATEEVKILAFCDLADTQPIGKSGVPTGYLNHPNMRLFYQLKTFMLNQMSLFYADSLVNIQKGLKHGNKKQFIKGVTQGFKLVLLLTAGNASADALKNLIMGREIDLEDTVISNLLWNIGVSKYTFYKGKRDGYANALLTSYILPPQVSAFDDVWKDTSKMAQGKREVKDSILWTYFPFGRSYYWWFGGGRTRIKEQAEKERKKKRSNRRKRKDSKNN